MKRPFVTVVLAGGKGTRMGSSDKHKVCFEVLGVPVIIRALETYNLCGSMLNVVVVGMMAESVMATVNQRFPGTVYAFQEKPLGTGNAARKAAEILERMRFDGDVLVVAGDKMIAPRAIHELLATHQQSGAAVTLATAKRPPNSSAGILLKSARGNIVGILEESERQRLVALAKLTELFRTRDQLSRETVEHAVTEHCREKAARTLIGDLWRGDAKAGSVRRAHFEKLFSRDERAGILKIGDEPFPAEQVLARFDQMNLSTYFFRAPVLYDALNRLKPTHANGEEYLTDVFALLARAKQPARVVGCEIADPRDLMTFNNPQELLEIEEVYQQKQASPSASTPSDSGHAPVPASRWHR